MELRHLRYFVAVAEELSFTKAAERLQMAQPPLSQQVKKLEEYLGVSLLNRTQRKVELTEAGQIFLERCYEIIDLASYSAEEAIRVQNGEMGQLVLGFTGSITFDLLPKILRVYKAAYPKVHIILKQLTTSEQMEALNSGSVDVGLLVSPVESTTLELVDLHDETFLAVLPRHHWLASSDDAINPYLLKNESFIITPRKVGAAYYDSTISFLQSYGITPKISFETQELNTSVALVAAGLGIALLPRSIQSLRNPNIVYKDLEKSFTTTISIAYSKKRNLPLVNPFIELIKEHFIEEN